MKSFTFVLGLLAFTLAQVSSAQNALSAPTVATYDTLANRRANIALPVYSAADKQKIADQAEYLIENHYVHRAQKLAEFHVDAVAELKAIQQNAQNLSDADLHGKLQSVFSRLRDLHTNYYYPKPFQCYSTLLPIAVDQAQQNGHTVVAVSGISTNADVLRLAPATLQITRGDILESFSGVDPLVVAQDFYEVGAGANPNAQIRRALQNLTSHSQMNSFLPQNDSEHLKFIKPDGTRYEIDLPWISYVSASCLSPVRSKRAKTQKDDFLQGVDPEQLQFSRFFEEGQNQNAFGAYISTTESSIRYQVLQNSFGNFGVIKMSSFSPTSTDSAIALLTDLLQNKFQNTKGLIIDLRGNGGGNITFGERMLQLFTPKNIETENFQMVANAGNLNFLQATQYTPEYIPLVTSAIAQGASLVDLGNLTPTIYANEVGQSYLKPVVVLTDSACFSTCDMFTAGMQDNGAALVIATDDQTGGGGANVMAYSSFAGIYPQGSVNPFVTLPGSQEMRTAWRRSIRVGKNAGKVLESAGVSADLTIKPTLQDFIVTDSDLFTQVTQKLSDQYQASSLSGAQIQMDTSVRVDFAGGTDLSIPVKLAGTSFVEARLGSALVSKTAVHADSEILSSTSLDFPAADLAALPDLSTIELSGTFTQADSTEARVWRKIVSLRRIPAVGATLPMNLDFVNSSSLAPLTLYQQGPEGWKVVNGQMRIGAGPNYQDEVHAEASLFTEVPATAIANLNFTAELHSEKDYDFFSVSVFADGKETVLLKKVSGDVASKDYTYDLSPFAGKKIEVRFTFDSDPGVNAVGPTISKLNLQVALP